jgi:ubiquinone/menaquinone biosynthesis C-methylase UbiE/DNA-binding transcriptional ArsR family regulator
MDRTPATSNPKPDALLGWMASLADPTRLRLLRLLERNELGVAEMCDVLQLPQSTVSRHLKVLADERWTRSRRQGTTHLYRTILDELAAPQRKLWLLAREQTDRWPAAQQDQLRLERVLRERQTDPQAFFAGAAGQWDKLRGELYGNAFTSAALLALLPRDLVVADVGCGTGQVAAMLAPNVRQVIAIDNSAEMLKAAKRRLSGAKSVDLRRGEIEHLPIDAAAVDAALMLLVLSYVPNPAAAIAELSRILKPAGRAIIVDLLPHDRDDFRRQMGQQSLGFAPEAMRELLTANGFISATVNALPPEPNAKGPALFLATAERAA